MNIDEVMSLVISLEVEANCYDEDDNASIDAVKRARVALCSAIEQHVAEEIAREREAVLSLADSEATTLIAVAEHLRSRQEFTLSELHMAKAQALVEFRAAIRARGTK